MPRFLLLCLIALFVSSCAADSSSVFDEETGEDEDTPPRGFDTEPLDTGDDDVEDAVDDVDADGSADTSTEGGFLDPCSSDLDCLTGYCVLFEGERVCTEQCFEGVCEDGWECRFLAGTGADAIRMCVPMQDLLCSPCASDLDCGGFGDLCVRVGDSGFCTRDCEGTTVCPTGYVCDPAVSIEGESGRQCLPTTGRCSCPPDRVGESRDCVRANVEGICQGVEVCEPDIGWSRCSAPTPGGEICDGIDNDCDNLVDEGLVARPCSSTPNPNGTCEGLETCGGAAGWSCDAPQATIEICDGLDNDCNGQIDDGLCYDGNPCTRDICDPESPDNCTYPPFNGPCDDGNLCTINTLCVDGACTGPELDCDDGNECTADSCNAATGCQNRISPGAPCETGNFCTSDTCNTEGLCTPGPAVSCGTPDVCLQPSCDPAIGCTTVRLSGGRCDDGDSCTVNDVCSNGTCVAGSPFCQGHSCSDCDGEWGVSIDGTCLEVFGSPQCTCFCF